MFRFGFRRGKGKFLETFGGNTGTARERKQAATIERIASVLAQSAEFAGFEDEATRAILGDLLLSFCLENRKRALGQQEQVQRVAPAHYMSGWIDLPDSVVHLRLVPEMVVAMLADQNGKEIRQSQAQERTWFAADKAMTKTCCSMPLTRAWSAVVCLPTVQQPIGLMKRHGLGWINCSWYAWRNS